MAEELGSTPFYEPVEDNPILEKYYEDPERYGFALQIFFLNKRFKAIKKAYEHDDNVLDRSIYEDKLFTYVNMLEGNITEEEFNIYSELLDNMMEELEGLPKKAPDLLVYLATDFEHVMGNIAKRGREYEQVDGGTEEDAELLEYYRLLHSHYDSWYENYDKGPKMRIEADELDINKDSDWEIAYAKIRKEIDKIR